MMSFTMNIAHEMDPKVKLSGSPNDPNNHESSYDGHSNPDDHPTMDTALMSFAMSIAHEMELANQF